MDMQDCGCFYLLYNSAPTRSSRSQLQLVCHVSDLGSTSRLFSVLHLDGPRLTLTGAADGVEDCSEQVDAGRDEEHVTPSLSRLL